MFDLYELRKMINNCFDYMEEDVPCLLTLKNPYTKTNHFQYIIY